VAKRGHAARTDQARASPAYPARDEQRPRTSHSRAAVKPPRPPRGAAGAAPAPRRARRAQVESASFGADALGAIGIDAGTLVSTLSSTGGPGICVNYWTDGPSKYNNGGNGYLDALRALNPGTLRYPGGEKADSCAPPCPPSHPLPLRGPRGRLRGRRGAAAACQPGMARRASSAGRGAIWVHAACWRALRVQHGC